MRTFNHTAKSILGAALLVAASALTVNGALAANGGSTDIYSPEGFVASFGAPARSPVPVLANASYNGSTDAWGANGFRTSFGPGNAVLSAQSACRSASTDIWGANAFQVSFGEPALHAVTVADLAAACETVLR